MNIAPLLYPEDESVQSPLSIRSNYPHFSSMGYFTGDLLPGQLPYQEKTFVCFPCGKFTDIFGGSSTASRWVCHRCIQTAVMEYCERVVK